MPSSEGSCSSVAAAPRNPSDGREGALLPLESGGFRAAGAGHKPGEGCSDLCWHSEPSAFWEG